MKTRILTSAVILAVTVPLLLFSEYIAYSIVLGALAVIGVFEALRVLEMHKSLFVAIPAYLIAAAMPVAIYIGRHHILEVLLAGAFVFLAYLLYLFALAVAMRGEMKLSTISSVYIWVTYIVASFSAATLIRYINENGLFYVPLVFIASWICDVFAYLTGSMFGKHKLIPEISPKKTIEGSVGGIVFATLAFVLYGFLISVFTTAIPNYIVLTLSGFVLSIVSQIGDLAASLLKREHGVKDYGRIFPGHGGVLDRFDSVMAVSCILMIIVVAFPPFGF